MAVSDPKKRKEGMLVDWNQDIEMKHLWGNNFCMQPRIVYEQDGVKFWIILCMIM